MANEIIRPTLLPPRANPVASEVVPSDNGGQVAGVTWAAGVNAGRPVASQAEAVAGTDSSKSMSALTTKQSIASEVGASIASKEQGDLAASAVQPEDLALVATSGEYADLEGKPTLGTAAAAAASDFAPAAAGLPAGGGTGQVLTKASAGDHDSEWTSIVAPPSLTDQPSKAAATLLLVPPDNSFIRTAGASTAGDGGAALYMRAAIEPAHGGKFQSADGAWWELISDSPHLVMFDGGEGRTGAENAAAITRAASYLTARKLRFLEVSGSLTVEGLSREASADISFIGEGVINNIYRKRVIPKQAEFAVLDFIGDLIPSHLTALNSTNNPVVAVIGDSTGVPSLDGGGHSDVFFGLLQARFFEEFSDRGLKVYNRSIGGTGWEHMSSAPPPSSITGMPWYNAAEPNKIWLSYVRDLNPDTVIINFGQNNAQGLSPTGMMSVLNYIRTWDKVPDIVLATPHSPSIGSDYYPDDDTHEARDRAAGLIRSFAQFHGLGLLDINRSTCIARDGFDPRRASILRASEVITPVQAGTTWRADAEGELGHFRGRVRFNGAIWPSGSTDNALLLSFGAGDGGDYVSLRKRANGNIGLWYRAGTSTDVVWIYQDLDTGVLMPTAAGSDLWFEVSDGVFRLYNSTGSYVPPVFEGRLWGFGKPRTAYALSTGTGVTLSSLEVWPCEYNLSLPIITDTDAFKASEYFSGNGINHLNGLGAREIAWPVVRAAVFRADLRHSTVFSGVVTTGTPASTAPITITKTIPKGEVRASDIIEVEVSGQLFGAAASKKIAIKVNSTEVAAMTTSLASGASFIARSRIHARMGEISRANSEISAGAASATSVLTIAGGINLDSAINIASEATGSGTLNDVIISTMAVRVVRG